MTRAMNSANRAAATKNHGLGERDLVITVEEGATKAIMTIRLNRAGKEAAIVPHSTIVANGWMRGTVCFASKLKVDSGRQMVTLRPRGIFFKYFAITVSVFLLFQISSLLKIMGSH